MDDGKYRPRSAETVIAITVTEIWDGANDAKQKDNCTAPRKPKHDVIEHLERFHIDHACGGYRQILTGRHEIMKT
jgi:hypothetical protein